MDAKHGALKTTIIDVIGRVGNLVMSDTGDWRFSNFFKNPSLPLEWQEGYENLVRKADLASKNLVIAEDTDIRGLPVGALTRWGAT